MTERVVPTEIGVTYPALPIPQAHPSRIAAICRLRGLSSAPPADCRVLELGCASGGHLLPLAVTYPRSTFVGLDVDRPEIEKAQRIAARLGLANARFLGMGVEVALEALAGGPRFDYIIAHGLYSWIPDSAREAMLQLCGAVLAENGVVYLSYNTMPGGHLRNSIRDMLKFNARRAKSSQEALVATRSFLEVLESSQLARSWPAAARYELAQALRGNDTRLLFDDLAPETSFYLDEVIARAERHGLAFAGEAMPSASLRLPFGGRAKQLIERAPQDSLEQESLLDLLMLRRFRRTLLCRQGLLAGLSLDEGAVDGLHAAAAFTAPPKETLGASWSIPGSNGSRVRIDSPLAQAALMQLGDAYPESIEVSRLEQQASAVLSEPTREKSQGAGDLRGHLVRLYEHGIVDLLADRVQCSRVASERPLGFAYARASVELARPIVNLLHHPVTLDVADATLLALLDGSHSREDISAAFARNSVVGCDVQAGLIRLAQYGLLSLAAASLDDRGIR